MSRYTITISELVARGYNFGLDDYPIFDEEHRAVLNRKILDHYWFHEIGQETPDRFRFMMNRKMREIMPLYNQWYESAMIEFDPLMTDYVKEREDSTHNAIDMGRAQNKGCQTENTGDVFTANRDETTTSDSNGSLGEIGHSDVKRTLDMNRNKTYDEEGTDHKTTGNTRTEDLSEKHSDTKTGTSSMDTDTDGTRTTTVTGTKSDNYGEVFSDTPQTSLSAAMEANPKASAPRAASTIASQSATYATTLTSRATDESANTSTKENTNSTENKSGRTSEDSDGTITHDNTITDSGTDDGNYTKHGTEGQVNADTETTGTDSTNNQTTTDHTQTTGNFKDDQQRNVSRETQNGSVNTSRSKRRQLDEILRNIAGRRGVSPSRLLIEFRETFVNIDMMVIEELENLFMGVY